MTNESETRPAPGTTFETAVPWNHPDSGFIPPEDHPTLAASMRKAAQQDLILALEKVQSVQRNGALNSQVLTYLVFCEDRLAMAIQEINMMR